MSRNHAESLFVSVVKEELRNMEISLLDGQPLDGVADKLIQKKDNIKKNHKGLPIGEWRKDRLLSALQDIHEKASIAQGTIKTSTGEGVSRLGMKGVYSVTNLDGELEG